MWSICLFLSFLLVNTVVSHPAADKIENLPGLNYNISFLQYSGYLNGTTGRKLHYWFTESATPTTDPLLLWLNGGPGCSSMEGLLAENGPFSVSQDGTTLIENPYAWNLIGNVLYLESPACVGFSYDENNNCGTVDSEVAEMNYRALQQFYAEFEEYRDRDFYITGESYAGVYIPTLAVKIVQGYDTYPINLKGFAIGNGLLSYSRNRNSLMFFGYYHALLGQSLWNNLVESCCGGVESQATCDFGVLASPICLGYVADATDIMYYSGLNMYNLYADCATPGGEVAQMSSSYTFDRDNLFPEFKKGNKNVGSDHPCTDSSNLMAYLNNPDVRAALHIPPEVQDWELCSDAVNAAYAKQYFDMVPQLKFLQRYTRGLIYNGDVDMSCNCIGNEWTVAELNYTVVDSRKKWTQGGQVAGFVERYENLDFVTVRGSGHMVPEDKPAPALQMITAFINNTPYGN